MGHEQIGWWACAHSEKRFVNKRTIDELSNYLLWPLLGCCFGHEALAWTMAMTQDMLQ